MPDLLDVCVLIHEFQGRHQACNLPIRKVLEDMLLLGIVASCLCQETGGCRDGFDLRLVGMLGHQRHGMLLHRLIRWVALLPRSGDGDGEASMQQQSVGKPPDGAFQGEGRGALRHTFLEGNLPAGQQLALGEPAMRWPHAFPIE